MRLDHSGWPSRALLLCAPAAAAARQCSARLHSICLIGGQRGSISPGSWVARVFKSSAQVCHPWQASLGQAANGHCCTAHKPAQSCKHVLAYRVLE